MSNIQRNNIRVQKEFSQKNSSDSMFKLKANCFGIDKVQMAFVRYDKNNKLVANIDIYIDVDELLYLNYLNETDKLAKLYKKSIQDAKTTGQKYPQKIYQSKLGGISEQKANEKGLRSDGFAISRYFDIAPANSPNYDYVVTGYSGAGKTDDRGLIVPQGRPDTIIRIPITAKDLTMVLLRAVMEWVSFNTAQYTRGVYDVQTYM